jgi:hypothetical protein
MSVYEVSLRVWNYCNQLALTKRELVIVFLLQASAHLFSNGLYYWQSY